MTRSQSIEVLTYRKTALISKIWNYFRLSHSSGELIRMATIPSPAEVKWQEEHINDSKVLDVIAVNVVCFSIASIAILLRFQARRMAKVKYELDDWLIIVGWVRRWPTGISYECQSQAILRWHEIDFITEISDFL